jgi:hypothetical protein
MIQPSIGEVSVAQNTKEITQTNEMDAAAGWLLRDGLAMVQESGPESIKKYLMESWFVILQHKVPCINTENFIVLFSIIGFGQNYEIECVQQVFKDEYVYEYWIFKINGSEWQGERAEFYITKAKGMYGVREVVHSSDQFFESYEVDGVQLKLPVNDLEFLYRLQAWRYPASYKTTDLANFEISGGKYGYYVVSDAWYGNIGHLFRNLFGPERKKTTLK